MTAVALVGWSTVGVGVPDGVGLGVGGTLAPGELPVPTQAVNRRVDNRPIGARRSLDMPARR
jgi:hypothetical protein